MQYICISHSCEKKRTILITATCLFYMMQCKHFYLKSHMLSPSLCHSVCILDCEFWPPPHVVILWRTMLCSLLLHWIKLEHDGSECPPALWGILKQYESQISMGSRASTSSALAVEYLIGVSNLGSHECPKVVPQIRDKSTNNKIQSVYYIQDVYYV